MDILSDALKCFAQISATGESVNSIESDKLGLGVNKITGDDMT